MTRSELAALIRQRGSYLCIGLDTDPAKLPTHLRNKPDGVYQFNKAIIDATRDLCVSYKINTAFYEARGAAGWADLERTVRYIPEEIFRIADAKRGDIGNTADQYAHAFFEALPFDAVTVAPYMGADSVKPFLQYPGKWAIVLGLTSNAGARDFEWLPLQEGGYLYEEVMRKVSAWGNPDNLMFVVGATQADAFTRIRELIPAHFLLVPGVGAQGGSLEDISRQAMNADTGLLVNVSRAVIYASSGTDFAEAARRAAQQYRAEMRIFLEEKSH